MTPTLSSLTPTDKGWFEALWRTPQQTRDLLIELSDPVTTKRMRELRTLCHQEIEKRKDNPLFVECPCCKNKHGQLTNIDNLCEKHEAQLAPLRYDTQIK